MVGISQVQIEFHGIIDTEIGGHPVSSRKISDFTLFSSVIPPTDAIICSMVLETMDSISG